MTSEDERVIIISITGKAISKTTTRIELHGRFNKGEIRKVNRVLTGYMMQYERRKFYEDSGAQIASDAADRQYKIDQDRKNKKTIDRNRANIAKVIQLPDVINEDDLLALQVQEEMDNASIDTKEVDDKVEVESQKDERPSWLNDLGEE